MTQRRLTSRRWGPDSDRVDAAEAITGPTRHGTIDGVAIDLRHPDIKAEEWEPRPWWHLASDSAGSARLSFPSDVGLGVPALGGAVELRPGDRVSVAGTSSEDIGAKFLHAHDRSARLLELIVTRADGSTAISPHTLRLFGTTELRNSPPHEAFDRMALRAVALVDVERLNDYRLSHIAARKKGLADEATYFLRAAESSYRSLERSLAQLDEEDDKNRPYSFWGSDWWRDDLVRLLNQAAVGGYLLARSETDGLERSIVDRNRNLDEGRGKLKDYDGRRPRAREIWAKHPRYTINRVATEIARELGKDKASVMASLWSEVPETSPSYSKALEKVRAGQS